MFSAVTWGQYFIAIGFALLAYYIVIALKFFKWELLAVAGIHKEANSSFSNVSAAMFSAANSEAIDGGTEVDLSPVLQDFRDELAAFAVQASSSKFSSEDAMQGVQTIVSKYPVLNTSEHEAVRNDIILQELHDAGYSSINYKDLPATSA